MFCVDEILFIFIFFNYSNDSKIGCKSPSSLVKFIDMDGDFEKELEEFEDSFEQDEVLDL